MQTTRVIVTPRVKRLSIDNALHVNKNEIVYQFPIMTFVNNLLVASIILFSCMYNIFNPMFCIFNIPYTTN
jgi:hypothetical protein